MYFLMQVPDDATATRTEYGWTFWLSGGEWVLVSDEKVKVLEMPTITVKNGERVEYAGDITGDIVLDLQATTIPVPTPDPDPPPPPPPPPDPPPATQKATAVYEVNVRTRPTIYSKDIGDVQVGQTITIYEKRVPEEDASGNPVTSPRFIWTQVRTEAGTQFVAEKELTGAKRTFLKIEGDTPPPAPTPSPAPASRVKVVNGRVAIDNTAKRLFAASGDRLLAYKEQNQWAVGMADKDYWGDPALPDDKTFGKLRDIASRVSGGPTLVRYFAVHDKVGFAEMVKANVRMLDWLAKFGLFGVPILCDSLHTTGSLPGEDQYHTDGNFRHHNGDYWKTDAWRRVYMDFLNTLLPAIKAHPALGGVCLMNEPQVSKRDDLAVKNGFIEWAQVASAAVRKYTGVPITLGIINSAHVWDGGITFARELYSKLPDVDCVNAHHYQRGAGVSALWEHERASLDDAQVASELGKAYVVWEFGQDGDRPIGEQVDSARNYMTRQYKAGASLVAPWAFDYRNQDINLGSGTWTPYGNQAFFALVEMVASGNWQ